MDHISPEVQLLEFSQIHRLEYREELFKFRFSISDFKAFVNSTSLTKSTVWTTLSHGTEQIEWRIQGTFKNKKMSYQVEKISEATTTYAESVGTFHIVKSNGKLNFLKTNYDDVLSRGYMYMSDGALTLQCNLSLRYATTAKRFALSMDHASVLGVGRELRDLQANFTGLHVSQKHSDVVLRCGDQDFKAHKLILSTRCSVFDRMFEHDTKENRECLVAIEDSTPEAVRAMIRFLYVGELEEPNTGTCLQLYPLADRYDLQVLKSLCSEFVASNLTVDHVIEAAILAHLVNDEELMLAAKQYFHSNMKKIISTKAWVSLASEYQDLAQELAR